jgi:spore maturation protein B
MEKKMLSRLILPLIVLFIIVYGIIKKVNVYDVFIEGAKESFEMFVSLFPPMLAMIFAINLFIKSNCLNYFLTFLSPLFNLIKVPLEIIPMAIMRPISGSSSLAILNNILSTNGPDSLIGRIASVMQGSTDTTLYVLTLYFGSVGIKKIGHSLKAGVLADLFAIVLSIIVVNLIF